MPVFTAKEKDIIAERGKRYGPVRRNNSAIALAWNGYLTNLGYDKPDLSDIDVYLLMSLAKHIRLANDPFHTDSYDDIHIYLKFAEAATKGEL